MNFIVKRHTHLVFKRQKVIQNSETLRKFYMKLKLKKKTGSSKNKDKIYNSLLKNFIKSEKGTNY